jgi:AraC family ethanolamine operon transcriptional activator
MERIPTSATVPPAQSLETHDFGRLAQAFRRWDHRFEQLGRGAFRGRVRFADLDGVQLLHVEVNRSLRVRGARPAESFTFSPIETANAGSTWRGRILRPGMVSVAHPRHAIDHRTNPDYRQTAITVGRDRLEAVSSTLMGVDVATLLGPDPDRPLQVDEAGLAALRRRWRRALRGLLRHDRGPNRGVRPVDPDELVADLLRVLAAGRIADPFRVTSTRRLRLVRDAEEYARSAPGGAATVLELCRLTGVSERTLHYAFVEVTGLSPVGYLKTVRLNRARRELMEGGAGRGRVEAVARNHGFHRPGNFASDYRRLFAELPSESLGMGGS